jgi:hypothetical protein
MRCGLPNKPCGALGAPRLGWAASAKRARSALAGRKRFWSRAQFADVQVAGMARGGGGLRKESLRHAAKRRVSA